MSASYKSGGARSQRVALSSTNPVTITQGLGEGGEITAVSGTGTQSTGDPEPGTAAVEMEEMADVSPSINGGGGREERDTGSSGKRYELSPSSDYNLLEAAAAQLSSAEEDEIRRLSRNRRPSRRRDFALRLLAHSLTAFVGEFVGTFVLTLCITSAVASSVMADALSGLWQVAVVSGLGVAVGIYLSAHISDAHLNPAVTLAFAIVRCRAFSWRKLPVYIAAQMLGGFMAGVVLYGTYHNAIESFEERRGIERGLNGSELSGMIFGEYFPNPALFPGQPDIATPILALATEVWATCVLVFVVFAFTDPHNTTVGSGKHKVPVPILIGATVMVLISLYAPLTQAGLNPARDFGPRLFAAVAGWGKVAIPGPRNGFWVYIVGPLIGGLVGGALYDIGAAKAMQFKMQMKKSHHTSPQHHK